VKIKCQCGFLIIDSTDGLRQKAHVIPDQVWDPLWTAIDKVIETRGVSEKERESACMKLRDLVGKDRRSAWQCANCGSLHIDDARHVLHSYAPLAVDTSKSVFAVRTE